MAALDRLSAGVMLFGADGLMVFAYRAAQRILAEEDGLRMRLPIHRSSLGAVMADDLGIHEALHAAIQDAVSPMFFILSISRVP